MFRTIGARLRRVVVIALCAVVAACTPEAVPAASPSPSPTPTVTLPRPESDYERQQRLDFEAAERAYRANAAEVDRLLALGGADRPTSVLLATSGGAHLESTMAILRQVKSAGFRIMGTTKIVRVVPGGHRTSRLTLTACEDTTSTRKVGRDGRVVPLPDAGFYVQSLTVSRMDGAWKLSASATRVVTRLDASTGCGQ